MAEFVMRDIFNNQGLQNQFEIASAATSTEEIGNSPHRGTKAKLRELGISTEGKYSVQLTKADYSAYDYLIGMDHWNLKNMKRICGGDPNAKIHLLLDYTDRPGDIADPWYTGNFEQTYKDIKDGCEGLLKHLLERKWQ